jgi:hypothetical protein
VDNEKLRTPDQHFICHENLKILESIQFELECIDELNPSIVSTYSLLSREIDWFDHLNFQVEFDKFRSTVLSDGTLRDCAGPERIDQRLKWGALFEYLSLLNMEYPSLIQGLELSEIEEWIEESDANFKHSIDKFVRHFYDEYNLLSSSQKTTVLSATNLHGSIIYGIFLATKQSSELEYTAAILAGQCLIPNVFGDVIKEEYKGAFDEIKNDALILTNYLNLSNSPGISIQRYVNKNIHNWAFLPEAAKYSLLEAVRQSQNLEIQDYSSAVLLFGKSLEICLKKLIFDEFKSQSGITFREKNETSIFIENNNQIAKFATYIVKPPHHIELGSMLFILEKHGGRTASANLLLKEFFQFVSEKLEYHEVIKKDWIAQANIITQARNDAAHSGRFNLEELKKIESLMYNLLKAFR